VLDPMLKVDAPLQAIAPSWIGSHGRNARRHELGGPA
jgi:hypothetical protein